MTKHVFRRLPLGLLLALTIQQAALSANLDADDVPPPAWSPIPFARPSEFANHMAQQHAWPRDKVEALFADYKANAQVIRLMEPAAQSFKRSWAVYRKRFIEPKRIAAGVDFWNENQKALERAGQRFGVPAHVIVGIIGIETIYGRNTGNFQVLEALATLSFDYPRRAAYFAKELEHFLLWTQDQGIDPKSVRGSFAGAIGLPQFMPGSIRRHAVDFDGDGSIDLAGSKADAIGSVASFLKRHGWQAQSKQKTRIQLRAEQQAATNQEARKQVLEAGWQPRLLKRDIEDAGLGFPKESKEQTARHGKEKPTHQNKEKSDQRSGFSTQPWAVFELPNADAPSTWIATDHNFWVITRYNQSPFYAMAVLELGEAVRDERRRQISQSKTRKPKSNGAKRDD
jgi:membrane-bound lytic murein transglycosylase B